MKELLEELAETIKAEIEVQERTLNKLEEQQQYVVEHTLEKLEGNITELDSMIPDFRRLEKSRLELRKHLAARLGLDDSVTLKTIIEKAVEREAHEPLDHELADLRNRLVELAGAVRAKSKQNMILLRQAIELNHDLRQKFLGVRGNRVSTYGQDGELVASTGSGVFNTKV